MSYCFVLPMITVLWRSLIVKHKGILNTNLDVSSLAKVTDGYTPGHVDEVRQLQVNWKEYRCYNNNEETSLSFGYFLFRSVPVC